MLILAKKMDQSHAKNNWIEQICNSLVQLSILIGVMQIAYFSQYYPSPGNQKALIFYPSAKVDTTSYAPLLKQIASTYQVDCFLVDMPCRFAIYGMNKSNQLMEK